jgi:hypothetical protein
VSLESGQNLAHYPITALIGARGMGEVYHDGEKR